MERHAAVPHEYDPFYSSGPVSHLHLFLHSALHFHFFTPQEQRWSGPVIQLSNRCARCWVYQSLCTSSPHSITFTVNLPYMPLIFFGLHSFSPHITSRINSSSSTVFGPWYATEVQSDLFHLF